MTSKERKAEIVAEFGKNPQDTGSPEVQIALLTERIRELTVQKCGNGPAGSAAGTVKSGQTVKHTIRHSAAVRTPAGQQCCRRNRKRCGKPPP